MYDKAGLVHADLSEYNLLWQDDTLYVIDVGQAVEKNHPFSHQFLLRDCHNVCEVKKISVSWFHLLNKITCYKSFKSNAQFLLFSMFLNLYNFLYLIDISICSSSPSKEFPMYQPNMSYSIQLLGLN